jgi:hypothetical protein
VADDRDRHFTEDTRRFWEAYTHEELTPEDAREISSNAVAFIELLLGWAEDEKVQDPSQGPV